ncbi:MAG: glycosyltransferase family 87 protein [Myxococcota bacterium]
MSHLKAYAAFIIVLGVAGYLAVRWPQGPRSRRGWLSAAAFVVVAAGLLLKATDTPWFGDYESAYFPAGQLILSAPERLYGQECAFGFVNLPLVADFLVPLSALGYRPAVLAFTLIGLLLTAGAVYLMIAMPGVGRPARAGAAIAVVAINGPLWYSVREGNLTHFLVLPLVFALGLLMARRDLLAGLILGLVSIIKLPLVLFAGYLVARWRFRAVVGFVVAIAAVVAASVLIHGMKLHELWLNQCILPYAGKPLAAFNVQSLTAFWARIYGGQTYSWTPTPIGGSFKWVQTASSVVLAGITATVLGIAGRPTTRRETALEFSIVVVFILLFSPLSWTHYFVFATIPLVMLVSGELYSLAAFDRRTVLAGVSVVLLSLPLRGFSVEWPAFRFVYDRFLASHHFYGGAILLGLLLYARLHRPNTGDVRP